MIDDNPLDIDLVELAFAKVKHTVDLRPAADGQLGIELLKSLLACKVPVIPHLAIIDINMPRIRGPEVLSFMKGNCLLRHVPVVMMSSSDLPKERAQCLRLGASMYLAKSLQIEDLYVSMRDVVQLLNLPVIPSDSDPPPIP
jgi:CheY-like chemotaxis protein